MAGRRPSRVLPWGSFFCARPVAAETLIDALSNAYLINPVLNAERANLRATDEQVAVAKSGLRPNINASGDAAFVNTETDIVGGADNRRFNRFSSAMLPPRQLSRPSAPRSLHNNNSNSSRCNNNSSAMLAKASRIRVAIP